MIGSWALLTIGRAGVWVGQHCPVTILCRPHPGYLNLPFVQKEEVTTRRLLYGNTSRTNHRQTWSHTWNTSHSEQHFQTYTFLTWNIDKNKRQTDLTRRRCRRPFGVSGLWCWGLWRDRFCQIQAEDAETCRHFAGWLHKEPKGCVCLHDEGSNAESCSE